VTGTQLAASLGTDEAINNNNVRIIRIVCSPGDSRGPSHAYRQCFTKKKQGTENNFCATLGSHQLRSTRNSCIEHLVLC
jgi:hypothetical protein